MLYSYQVIARQNHIGQTTIDQNLTTDEIDMVN